ncbi:MAG: AraC family transcriptional regulator [Sphaerochaeta sp.]|nr:AraC family transcriptional regulator [Sphaerochaeta sp.]
METKQEIYTREENRRIYFDEDLQIEAYSLKNIVQAFPNHFHSFYVIGYIASGFRQVTCKKKVYSLGPGTMVLFNPQDNHQCAPIDDIPLDYRAINVDANIMDQFAYEITGKELHPYFTQNVVFDADIIMSLSKLYDLIVHGSPTLEKEEAFCFLLEQLIVQFCEEPIQDGMINAHDFLQIQTYLEEHYAQNITLEQLSTMHGCSKSYLVRSFTRHMGISPYRYLQTIRLERAKKFLREGMLSIEVALECGFSDQSHFTNVFKQFIGLTPNQYGHIFHKRS